MWAFITKELSTPAYFGGMYRITEPGSYNGNMTRLVSGQEAREEAYRMAWNGWHLTFVDCASLEAEIATNVQQFI